MDKTLYELLREINRRKNGGVSSFKFNDERDQDLRGIDFELAFNKLKDLGFVTFSREDDLWYNAIFCRITYDGEAALSHGSYEAYLKSLPIHTPSAVNIDQSFKNFGTLSGSTIAVHSHHVNQTVREASGVEKLFQHIIETLQQDQALTETQRQELIEDVQSLKKELQRTKPRLGMITEFYSALGNTASIASYLPQLQSLIHLCFPK